MKTNVKIGQIYKCRDERRGKRWVRIEYIRRYMAHVSVRRGNSRTWIPSQRTIALSAFNDKRHRDYKLVEPK